MTLLSIWKAVNLRSSRNYCYATVVSSAENLLDLIHLSLTHKSLKLTQQCHARSLSLGFTQNPFLATKLISAYAIFGVPAQSQLVFDSLQIKSVYLWNSLINGFVKNRAYNEAFGWFYQMCCHGVLFDDFTLATMSKVCHEIGDLNAGKLIHGKSLKTGFVLDGIVIFDKEVSGFVKDMQIEGLKPDAFTVSRVHLGCCLIDMYSRSDRVEVGRRVFDRMKSRNVYAWTAMVNGYVQNGALEEGLVLFHEMQIRDGVEPNKVSLVSVLPACSVVAGLIGVKQIHGYAIRKQFNNDVSLCNALIDVYSKCGSLDHAKQVFEFGYFHRDPISWSSMISGYGLHGKGEEAVSVYNKMLQLGNKPDMITIVGVLSACVRAGLVGEGLCIYKSAINKYKIKPTVEICACVVDMLGRSGQLGQALDYIKTMPMEPSPSVWGALVNASIIHGNSEMQDLAYRFLIQLEPENPSNYVSLSNLHASSRRWDVVSEVRTMMKDRCLTKTPGYSWISINNTTHFFYAADKLHPCSKSIYELLGGLILLMKGPAVSNDFENFTRVS
ncbi:REPEAT-CONTAINING PROTEIN putative-RELATED [Salix koriyanagi]|uniref:REPEAT-CONTAINING PROTEIN putative-RELATED n=1 Tax=Salix koriyanagi TaxID=2511006 RepID=A0A9Q0WQ38_9ROSI|nr:REPEAT-CONTAINING PROTEIN putative-RELATED [Salix koriyanagi]